MSLGTDVQAYLPEAQATAESRMSETVTVGVMASVFDDATDKYVDTLTIHYSGQGRLKYPSMVVSEKTPVGQVLASQDVILSLPAGLASAVRINDTVTVTASPDEDLVGRTFRIKGLAAGGQVSASRFPVVSL